MTFRHKPWKFKIEFQMKIIKEFEFSCCAHWTLQMLQLLNIGQGPNLGLSWFGLASLGHAEISTLTSLFRMVKFDALDCSTTPITEMRPIQGLPNNYWSLHTCKKAHNSQNKFWVFIDPMAFDRINRNQWKVIPQSSWNFFILWVKQPEIMQHSCTWLWHIFGFPSNELRNMSTELKPPLSTTSRSNEACIYKDQVVLQL